VRFATVVAGRETNGSCDFLIMIAYPILPTLSMKSTACTCGRRRDQTLSRLSPGMLAGKPIHPA
jgi:hypothetical protein